MGSEDTDPDCGSGKMTKYVLSSERAAQWAAIGGKGCGREGGEMTWGEANALTYMQVCTESRGRIGYSRDTRVE